MSYLEHRHDNLTRCKVCKFKYDLGEMFKTQRGEFVCRFCVNVEGVSNV